MFSSNRKETRNGAAAESTSLIAAGTEVRGDVVFGGRLHIDGKVEGSIRAAANAAAVLTLSR
jgi:cytoskeletal protein CcmA (bactofilin family)